MPRLHLGINTCFAVKRWPEPAQWLAIVKDELGLDCCQFSLDLADPLLDEAATAEYAAETRALAAERGVLLHSAFTGLAAYSWSQLLHPSEQMRAAAQRWYERAIDFTARLGAWGTGGHIGAFSVQDAASADRRAALLADMSERLRSLSRYAAARGLRFLLFENMAVEREYGHSIEEARALSAQPAGEGVPLVLCLDVGHPCALHTGTASDDYRAWLAHPWPRTPVIHLQQTDRGGDHHWPFTQAYNNIGMIRPADVLASVRAWPAESDVYLFLEPIHPFEADDANVLQDLRDSASYWKEAITAGAD
jgi:sugar phosphate isomerase/epimerase